MTQRRIPIAQLSSGERRLDGAVAHHLVRVLRLRSGDRFVGFDPATGREAEALALSAEDDALTVRFDEPREGHRRGQRGIVWIQALAKGAKCDAVVRDATELGATTILVAATKRSVVRLDGPRGDARAARWARIAQEAARQCGRSDAPIVEPPATWSDALARVEGDHARFCLWEHATDALGPALFDALARDTPLAFACGPEGGLEDTEVEVARLRGWQAVSLGPRLLRTETVAAAVLGAVLVYAC